MMNEAVEPYEIPEFVVTTSCHRMPCLQFTNASPELHKMLRVILHSSYMDDPDYKIRSEAGAFFQGGHDRQSGWLLIEFWNAEGAQAFVDYAKARWEAWQRGDKFPAF